MGFGVVFQRFRLEVGVHQVEDEENDSNDREADEVIAENTGHVNRRVTSGSPPDRRSAGGPISNESARHRFPAQTRATPPVF